jgi:hypothetical protein
MLKKLLKYDLKYMLRGMSVFYILAIFFAILTRIFSSVEQTVIATIIAKVCTGCVISMIANIIINVMLRSWLRFRDSIYKDEAYLTHTLPVTKKDIYASKFIQALIVFTISFLVIILSLFIAYYTKDNWFIITNVVNEITKGLSISPGLFITCFVAIIFLEVFNAIQCGFLGIILGYRRNNDKILLSITFGFIAYLIAQSLVLLLVFIVGLFDSSIMDLFRSTVLIDTGALKLLTILAIIFYILIIGIMYLFCQKKLSKGVNLE